VAAAEVDTVYRFGQAQIGAMGMITLIYGMAFLASHWAVVRLRHSEQAVRILRQALHAGAGGQVGRHTGTTLRDSYEVGPLLAAGGMGEVYKGFHRRTGRAIAVKFLHPHLVGDVDVLRRFRREAEIAGQLGSPHIVQVLDVDTDQEQPFIVLELLEGESLRACLDRDGKLPLALVADLVDQAADGLHQAHEAGVVHRDLKPENIFLSARDGEAPLLRILDFGISKIQGAATQLTNEVALLGTPDFMAPEQAEGRADAVDHRSDVFALGAIAYHAITGQRPFAGPSIPAVLRAICDRDPFPASALRPEAGADVDAVLAIAMAKRPEQRYAGARELARDLRAAIGGVLDGDIRKRATAVPRAAGAPSVPGVVGTADTLDAGIEHAATAAGDPPP
jgi:serine/threonine-protein kinase